MDRSQRGVAGGKAGDGAANRWRPLFIAAIIALAASFAVFVFVVAAKLGSGGDDDPNAALVDGGSPAPKSATAVPSYPPGPDGDTSPVVACGDILGPLDKNHRLTPDCAPSDLITLPANISAEGAQQLRAGTAQAIEQMFAAAKAAGFTLQVNSGYRSYQNQADTFNYWVQTDGLEYAERTSAHAGHSEHQLGTAADVGSPGHYLEDFENTPEATWLAQNSWRYGFIVSYPDGKEAITGYAPEPWHVRFIGVDEAAKVHASGLTLHEYLLKP